jgi:hypothetical protein
VADAYDFCGPYFLWCNEEHHHTGLALLTPATVHYGRTAAVLAERQAALDAVNVRPIVDTSWSAKVDATLAVQGTELRLRVGLSGAGGG